MTSWALIAACAVVLVLPLVWRARRRRFDPFEPIVLFALAWGAMFVVRPTAMLMGDERSFWGLDVLPTLPRALLLPGVGATAFVVGYELLPARRVAVRLPTPRPIDESIAVTAALVTCLVALVALAFFLPSNALEALRVLLGGRSAELGEALSRTWNYVVNTSLLFAPAALVLTALALRRRSPLLIATTLLVLLVALVRVLPAGGSVRPPALARRHRRARVRDARQATAHRRARGDRSARVRRLLFHPAVPQPTDDRTLETAVEELAERPHAIFDPVVNSADAEMVLSLSAALTVVPEELPHRWGGATVGNLATRPVPRELWSGKPRPPGETVVATIWPQHYPALNLAFTPLLPLYWDFGLLGVAAGMAVFGFLCRLLYEWFAIHRRDFVAQVVYAASVWFVVIAARNDPVDTIVLAAFLLAPVIAIIAVASEGVLPARIRTLPRHPRRRPTGRLGRRVEPEIGLAARPTSRRPRPLVLLLAGEGRQCAVRDGRGPSTSPVVDTECSWRQEPPTTPSGNRLRAGSSGPESAGVASRSVAAGTTCPRHQSALTRAMYEASLYATGTTALPRRAPDAIVGWEPHARRRRARARGGAPLSQAVRARVPGPPWAPERCRAAWKAAAGSRWLIENAEVGLCAKRSGRGRHRRRIPGVLREPRDRPERDP